VKLPISKQLWQTGYRFGRFDRPGPAATHTAAGSFDAPGTANQTTLGCMSGGNALLLFPVW
jgi:hypothetical protein